jgi:hypothetical protein
MPNAAHAAHTGHGDAAEEALFAATTCQAVHATPASTTSAQRGGGDAGLRKLKCAAPHARGDTSSTVAAVAAMASSCTMPRASIHVSWAPQRRASRRFDTPSPECLVG